jgi:hypothetical protein
VGGVDGEEGWDMAVSRGAEVAEKAEANLRTLFLLLRPVSRPAERG